MLTVGRKTEEVKFKSNIVYLITFILCVVSLGIAYKLVLEVGLIGIQDIKFTTSILLGVLGTFLLIISLGMRFNSGLIHFYFSSLYQDLFYI